MHVIGTAGHVDHGKSALVEALTGTHPDRLREEQERGLTTELGFAWFTLPSGREVSMVDVPGHVRFVRHMLAGSGAIDLALFVVAADEGVMPQTREHLEILDLLQVTHGVVALTKCDLVGDDDWLDLVQEEVRGLLEPTSLGGSPIVRVSAVTGAGLDELRAALDAALDEVPSPRDIGRPRLGIDRVFTMTGFGTVVTGTLLDGRLHVGETVEAVPGGPTARIRGLQTHRRDRDEAEPGTRVAVNLAGLAREDLRRGQVLAHPGRLVPARALDARVRVLEHRELRHNLRVALHIGADEVQARVRLLGSPSPRPEGAGRGLDSADELPAGSEGWCQLILIEPVAAVPGDLFVLRVSDETVAGGSVVDINPPRHRRRDPAVLARLESRAQGTPESRLLALIERREPATRSALLATNELDAEALDAALVTLESDGAVTRLEAPAGQGQLAEPVYATPGGLARLSSLARRAIDAYHRAHPLRVAMPRDELRGRLSLEPREFAAVLPALNGIELRTTGLTSGVAADGWTPHLTAAQRRAADEAVATLEAGGAAPPRLDLDAELLGYLAGEGRVVDCGDGVVLGARAFEAAREAAAAALRERGPLSLAELRDALGTNRRAAQQIMETLDRLGATRRQGETRVLAGAPLHSEGAS